MSSSSDNHPDNHAAMSAAGVPTATERPPADLPIEPPIEPPHIFRQVIEASCDSVLLVALDGAIVYANAATARTFGYSVETLIGQDASLLYPPSRNLSVEDLIALGISDRGKSAKAGFRAASNVLGWSGETTCQRQDRELFPAIVSVSPILNDRDRPRLVSIVCHDITTQKAIQAELATKNRELEQASRHKSSFLANMSHELRTPLTSILGFASLLLQGVFGELNNKQRGYLQDIEDSGLHLLALIKDILDLSKIEAGKIELEIMPCSLVAICHDTIGLVSGQARQKGIEIELAIAPDLDTIEADELRLRQMLLNLFSNALKFSEAGSRVGLEASRKGNEIELCVWDCGIGIAESELSSLFKPFYQADSSLSRHHEGTGLGLTLTYQFAQLHGGRVTCESQLGEGSRFTIRLPDVAEPIASVAALPEPPRSTWLTGTSGASIAEQDALILLVEDDQLNATLLRDMLEHWGYQVYHAASGVEALAWVTNQTPDLILMDVNLPGLDGLAVTRQLKLNPHRMHIPIVAMTALAMAGDRDRCLAAGMQDYITKPIVHSDHLADILDDYLSRPAE